MTFNLSCFVCVVLIFTGLRPAADSMIFIRFGPCRWRRCQDRVGFYIHVIVLKKYCSCLESPCSEASFVLRIDGLGILGEPFSFRIDALGSSEASFLSESVLWGSLGCSGGFRRVPRAQKHAKTKGFLFFMILKSSREHSVTWIWMNLDQSEWIWMDLAWPGAGAPISALWPHLCIGVRRGRSATVQ